MSAVLDAVGRDTRLGERDRLATRDFKRLALWVRSVSRYSASPFGYHWLVVGRSSKAPTMPMSAVTLPSSRPRWRVSSNRSRSRQSVGPAR